MAGPSVTRAIFERLPDDDPTRWKLRVHVFGSGFETRGLSLAAKVGDLEVEGIFSADPAEGFTGYLRDQPAQNSRLRVGYVGTALVDTDVRFLGQPIPPIQVDSGPNA
ncbi:MAG: hypothetical protein GEV11_12130 [Streptosporangiales bacterium]|nr:hypothetical protein [Streptosporangiales bacterium]